MKKAPEATPARRIMIVKIDPWARTCTLLPFAMHPDNVLRMTGKTSLKVGKVATVAGVTVIVTGDATEQPAAVASPEPRWTLGNGPVCHGIGIVCGLREDDNPKAISSPVDSVWVSERMAWL